MSEWAVDWECQVDVSVSTTVTVGRMEIIEAETAEEAMQLAKEEADITHEDIDWSYFDFSAFEIGEPEDWKVTTKVTEWGTA